MLDPCRNLLIAVIKQAARDFISPTSKEIMQQDAYNFLTGGTQISRYYFGLLEMPHLTGEFEVLQAELRQNQKDISEANRLKWGGAPKDD